MSQTSAEKVYDPALVNYAESPARSLSEPRPDASSGESGIYKPRRSEWLAKQRQAALDSARKKVCVPIRSQDCGGCDCNPYTNGQGGPDFSIIDRLSLQPKNKIDTMYDLYPFPCEGLPRNFLPAWRELPLYVKLPRVPAPPGALFFARGFLTRPLTRADGNYTVIDPLHQFRVPATEYNALHDTHAKGYLTQPQVRRLLINHGLITELGEVLCTQKDFNRFRAYLASLSSEKIAQLLLEGDKRWLFERRQLMDLNRYQRKLLGLDEQRLSKAEAAAKRHEEMLREELQSYEEKQKDECLRSIRWLQEKERQCISRKIESLERSKAIEQRKLQMKCDQEKKRRDIIMAISMKNMIAEERVRSEKNLQKQAYNQFLNDWLEAKCRYQEEAMGKKIAVQMKIEADIKRKAVVRQKRVERYRAAIPDIISRHKEQEQRIWNLVKKFFYRWLQKVRDRKSRKPDSLHQSLWDISGVMDETLKYLRAESGYEAFDDFMMTVLRMKDEIKLKLAEEEAAEAEAASAEEHEAEEEDSQNPEEKTSSTVLQDPGETTDTENVVGEE